MIRGEMFPVVEDSLVSHNAEKPVLKISFLQKVRVSHFVSSNVQHTFKERHTEAHRILETTKNFKPEEVFYVIGQTHRYQGRIHPGGYGDSAHFEAKSRHPVVRVTSKLNELREVLTQHIEIIEEDEK